MVVNGGGQVIMWMNSSSYSMLVES